MKKRPSRIRIYISYPYSDKPDKRIDEVKEIVKEVMEIRKLMGIRNGFVLFIPHFAFHAFNTQYGEELADEHCIELLAVSDMLCICLPKGEPLSRGMKIELDYARKHKMPIVYLEDFIKDSKKVLAEAKNLVQAMPSTQ